MRLFGESLIEVVQDVMAELGIRRYRIEPWDETSDEINVVVPRRYIRKVHTDEDGLVMLPDGDPAGWQYGVCVALKLDHLTDAEETEAFVLRFFQE